MQYPVSGVPGRSISELGNPVFPSANDRSPSPRRRKVRGRISCLFGPTESVSIHPERLVKVLDSLRTVKYDSRQSGR